MDKTIILETLGKVVRDALQCGPIQILRHTRATDVRGWDSLSQTIILLNLEDAFGIQIPVDSAMSLKNVGELVDLIVSLLEQSKG